MQHFERLVVAGDLRDRAVDVHQLIDRHLRRANRKFDREHDVVGDFDELADERQVLRLGGDGQGPVAYLARGMNMW